MIKLTFFNAAHLHSVTLSFLPRRVIILLKVCNVHGVRNEFISVGLDRSEAEVRVRQARAGVDRLAASTETATSLLAREEAEAELSRAEAAAGRGVYFLGKKLWTKGYRELLDLVGSQEVRERRRHRGAPKAGWKKGFPL